MIYFIILSILIVKELNNFIIYYRNCLKHFHYGKYLIINFINFVSQKLVEKFGNLNNEGLNSVNVNFQKFGIQFNLKI